MLMAPPLKPELEAVSDRNLPEWVWPFHPITSRFRGVDLVSEVTGEAQRNDLSFPPPIIFGSGARSWICTIYKYID